MTVTLIEAGLRELLDIPVGPLGRYVTAKAEETAFFARQNVTQNFKQRTGNLLQSIGTFPRATAEAVAVEVGTEGATYGRILEVGGEQHDIYRVNAPFLWSYSNNPTPLILPAVSVDHPGPAAQPWLVPALVQAGFQYI